MSAFFDTNVALYAQEEGRKGETARAILEAGGKISAQVLNEFAFALFRMFGRSWPEIDDAIADLLALVEPPIPLTQELAASARTLAAGHRLSYYDALIVAAAAFGGCETLFSEDLQENRLVGSLVVVNPFA